MPGLLPYSVFSPTRGTRMKTVCLSIGSVLALFMIFTVHAGEDGREFVQMPQMMQEHMLSNMRDHLAALNEILVQMAAGRLDRAADIAESRLGMSSLERHDASHMAEMMPEGMRGVGTSMHKAASHFALKAQEGEVLSAYAALSEVTAACVSCHSAYRIR